MSAGLTASPIANCHKCEGKGWYWRVPEGFNPFLAGGFSTAREMFKVTCLCSEARYGRSALHQSTEAGGE